MFNNPIRFTGLFSGMDTAGMVQQLMRAESMRMDRFMRRRTTLAWQQEQLRGTITTLNRWQTANTDIISPSSIMNPSVWNTRAATVTNEDGRVNPAGINVRSPGPNAPTGTWDIRVDQVARGDIARGDTIAGGVDLNMEMGDFLSARGITLPASPLGHTYLDINNQSFQVFEDETVGAFITRLNQEMADADAGAELRWDGLRGAFFLTATGVGAGYTLQTGTFDPSDGRNAVWHALGLDGLRPSGADPTDVDQYRQDRGFLRTAQDARIVITNRDDPFGIPLVIQQAGNTFGFEQHGIRDLEFTITNAARQGETFTLDIRPDVERTLDAIRDFVNNFNDLIRQINALHSTPRPRSQGSFFDPLTDAERAEMSDREIERWEEQARIGLLHRNDALQNLHRDLRNAMFQDVVIGPPGNQTRVNFSEFFTVGGQASRDDRNIGIIDIDWDRLRTALEDDPDRIQALFTRTTAQASADHPGNDWAGAAWSTQRNAARAPYVGLAQRLSDIIDNATHWDGSIRRQVGYDIGHDRDTNPLSRQIQRYDQRLEQMQRWLVRRENHFFAMFARMENALANANAQMDSLWMMGGM